MPANAVYEHDRGLRQERGERRLARPGASAVSIGASDTTDAHGRYLVCSVPVSGVVRLSVPHTVTTSVQVGSSGWIRQDLLGEAGR